LHSTNKDAEGWEWGVARVRVNADSKIEYLWGASDHSDLDVAMLASPCLAAARSAPVVPEEWKLVMDEVARATRKFPTWPTDPLHAVAVLGEEFGELTKAVLQTTYEPHKVKEGELRTEAIQTAAMALRFLASLDRYEFTQGAQHEQHGSAAPSHPEPAGGECSLCEGTRKIEGGMTCPHCEGNGSEPAGGKEQA
jgi:hypothetical protein